MVLEGAGGRSAQRQALEVGEHVGGVAGARGRGRRRSPEPHLTAASASRTPTSQFTTQRALVVTAQFAAIRVVRFVSFLRVVFVGFSGFSDLMGLGLDERSILVIQLFVHYTGFVFIL